MNLNENQIEAFAIGLLDKLGYAYVYGPLRQKNGKFVLSIL
jgi:hypothetical protein